MEDYEERIRKKKEKDEERRVAEAKKAEAIAKSYKQSWRQRMPSLDNVTTTSTTVSPYYESLI
ncbi:UNVERIFIED_CONTAM: hypothetical protein HDU68_007916 [Siphonaria sp. JEL0065]|nr:hypothetical protein HDU68_007916 [Siphonaria sp. JEL0065]